MTIAELIDSVNTPIDDATEKAIGYIFSDGLDKGKFPFSELQTDISNAEEGSTRRNQLVQFRNLATQYRDARSASGGGIPTEEMRQLIPQISALSRSLIEDYDGVYPSAFYHPNTARAMLRRRRAYLKRQKFYEMERNLNPDFISENLQQVEDLHMNTSEVSSLLANRAGFYRAFVEMLELEYGDKVEKYAECREHLDLVKAHATKLQNLAGNPIAYTDPTGLVMASFGQAVPTGRSSATRSAASSSGRPHSAGSTQANPPPQAVPVSPEKPSRRSRLRNWLRGNNR